MNLPKVLPARGMIIPTLILIAAALYTYNNVAAVRKVLGPRNSSAA